MATGEPARPRKAARKGLTRDINADTPMPGDRSKDDPFHKPTDESEYTNDKLDAGDMLDNVTDTFDGEINLPRS